MADNRTVEELLRKLNQLGRFTISQEQAPLSDAEIDRLLQDFPYKIPHELRAYYRRCNRVYEAEQESGWLFPGGYICTLQSAMEFYPTLVEIAADIPIDAAEPSKSFSAVMADPYFVTGSLFEGLWASLARYCLPIMGDGAGGNYIVICQPVEQATAPIYYIYFHGDELYLAFDSLTSLLATVVAAFEAGAYTVNEVGYVLEDRAKLAPIINHYNPHRRQYFLRSAQARSMSEVVANLAYSDPAVRKNAFLAVRYMYEPDTVPLLIKALQHPLPHVRRDAAQLLNEQRDPQAVDGLLVALHDGNAEVREFAAIALGDLSDPQAVDALIPLLNDDVATVRQRAASALGWLGDLRAIPYLIKQLNDPDKDARRFVELAIEQLERNQPS